MKIMLAMSAHNMVILIGIGITWLRIGEAGTRRKKRGWSL
jgi:hypothetical protein